MYFNGQQFNQQPDDRGASASRPRKVWRVLWTAIKILPYFLFSVLLIAVSTVLLAALCLAPYYTSLRDMYENGQSGETHLSVAEAKIAEKDFLGAGAELRLAETDFQAALAQAKVAKRSPVFISVYLRNQFGVAEDLLDIGARLSKTLASLSDIGNEITGILRAEHLSFADISPQKKGEVLQVVNDSLDELYAVRGEFSAVDEDLRQIAGRQPLAIFDKALIPLQQKIPKLEKAFYGLVTAAELAPIFAGYPQAKTYLLIMQNNRELRPSGGFIGTYGIIKIRNGELTQFFTDDVYNLDRAAKPYLRVEPPAPIKQYLRQEQWFLRDANWWPDFPASAEKVIWFYQEEGGPEKVDGVLALTPTVLEELLGVLGEITVGGITFNKINFWEQLEYQVEHGYYEQGIVETARKDIIGSLGKELLSRLYQLPMNQWLSLFDLAERLAKEKQVLMYVLDSRAESLIVAQDWAGEVKNSSGDYLLLVDANMASLKTDEVMRRTFYYTLAEQADGSLLAEARVNYVNTGEGHTWKTTRYRNYARLYAPLGSELLGGRVGRNEYTPGQADHYEEFGKTAWGIFGVIEPGQSQEFVWRYRLPTAVVESIKNGEYQLLFQKQPGLPSIDLRLDLHFANGRNVTHAETMRQDQLFDLWLE